MVNTEKIFSCETLARYLGKSRNEIKVIFGESATEAEVIKYYVSVGKTEHQYRNDFSRNLIRIPDAIMRQVRKGEYNLTPGEAKKYLKSRLRMKENNNWLFFENEIQPLNLDNEKLMSKNDLQELLGLSHVTTLKLLSTGEIPAKKVRNQWRIRSKDVEKYLTGNEPESESYGTSPDFQRDFDRSQKKILIDLEYHLGSLGLQLGELSELSDTFMKLEFLSGYGMIQVLKDQGKITKNTVKNIIEIINFTHKTDITELNFVNLDYPNSIKVKNQLGQIKEESNFTFDFIDQGRTLKIMFERN